jgi:hypothetical protein
MRDTQTARLGHKPPFIFSKQGKYAKKINTIKRKICMEKELGKTK